MSALALDAPSAATIGRGLSAANFKRLSVFITDNAGIQIPESKRTMLEGRLHKRVVALGMGSLNDYADWLFEADHLEREYQHLINSVTTNKTDFFREPSHFTYLTETLLPEFRARGVRNLRCWSAGCSIGAEAYTLAMVIEDFLTDASAMSYGILATDIDTHVLERARKGIYPADLVDPVPDRLARRFLMFPHDPRRAEVRFVPELRGAIGFAKLNLMEEDYPVGERMHLIFCRNTLIYFDKATQRKVVGRLIDCLAPDGYLFLGHSESIMGFDLPLQQVSNTIFRRR